MLAGILDDAVKERRLLANPARGVALPKRRSKRHVYLSHEDVAALARESGKHGTLVLVLAYCGLRWGEATGLRVRSIDFARRRITIDENAVESGAQIHVGTPKSHELRTVPFPVFLAEHLAKACEGKKQDDLVFSADDGSHLRRPRNPTATSAGGWFEHAVKRAGIRRVTPHDLRHTAASFAVSARANVKVLQRMLGHKSAAMTLDVYADLFADDLDTMATALHAARGAALTTLTVTPKEASKDDGETGAEGDDEGDEDAPDEAAG